MIRRIALDDRFESASITSIDVSGLEGALARMRDESKLRGGLELTKENVGALVELRAGAVRETLRRTSNEVWSLLVATPIAVRLGLPYLHANFDSFDIHLLPRYAATNGEVNPIDVSRFSPLDVTVLAPPDAAPTRLGGVAVGHFGSFLDRRWRLNDILWGRLDAADLIVHMLLPVKAGEPQSIKDVRNTLIERAQQAILASDPDGVRAMGELSGRAEELRPDKDPVTLHQLLKRGFVIDLTVRGDEQRNATKLRLLSRVPWVVGRVLANASPQAEPQQWSDVERKLERRRVDRAGRLVDSVVQLAVPQSFASRAVRCGVLPALVAGALLAWVFACPERWWQLLTIGGLVAFGACAVAAGRTARRPTLVVVTVMVRAVGVVLAVVGFLVPLAREDLAPDTRAWFYATLASALAVAYGALAVGRLLAPGALRTVAVWLAGLVAIGTFIGSLYTAWRTTMMVVGSLLLGATAAATWLVFARMQARIDRAGEPSPPMPTAASS